MPFRDMEGSIPNPTPVIPLAPLIEVMSPWPAASRRVVKAKSAISESATIAIEILKDGQT